MLMRMITNFSLKKKKKKKNKKRQQQQAEEIRVPGFWRWEEIRVFGQNIYQ